MHQASVVIPTHNRPHFLREALQSVVAQEGVELDVIVIGDGAGPDTAKVVADFPAVRYLNQAQAGPNTARNNAVATARFDCIALLDDDDLWLPGKMHTQLEILEAHPDAAYIFSDFHILRTGESPIPGGLSTWGIPPSEQAALSRIPAGTIPDRGLEAISETTANYYRVDLYRPLLQHPYVLPTTAVFRKSLLTPGIRFVDDDFICGDWEFFARLSRSNPAIYLPVETACNRSHEEDGRLTRTSDLIQLQRRLDMLDRVWAADEDFLRDPENRSLFLRTRHDYLLTLGKLNLRHGKREDVLAAFAQARAIQPELPLVLRLARSFAAIPGGLAFLRGLDRARLQLRSLLSDR